MLSVPQRLSGGQRMRSPRCVWEEAGPPRKGYRLRHVGSAQWDETLGSGVIVQRDLEPAGL